MNSKTIRKVYIVFLFLSGIMTAIAVYVNSTDIMDYVSREYSREIVADTMGIIASGIILGGLTAEKNIDKQNRAMFRMIFALVVLFFLDILTTSMEGNAQYIFSIKLINTLYFIFEDLMAFAYWTFIKEEIRSRSSLLKVADIICIASLGIAIILDLLNWKMGYFFTISGNGEYIDAPFEFIGDLTIISVFIIAFITIAHMKESSIRERMILSSFEVFPIIVYIYGSLTQQYVWVESAYLFSVMLIYIRIFSQRGKKLAEQQVTLTKQSTALMISQIQPHFLYNVLTTISNLCVTDPEEAEETTVLFSQYLRTNLDSLRNENPVSFATEMGHIRTYVELEKKRFGDILSVEYDINESNFEVPSLGLQPIVENSIKHGIRGKNDKGHLKIGSYKADNGYLVVIEDDGIGFDPDLPPQDDGRSHVGMKNVRERLKQMCNATMTVQSSPGNGCRTEIFFPG